MKAFIQKLREQKYLTVDNTILVLILIALAVFSRFLPFYITSIITIVVFGFGLWEIRKQNYTTPKIILIFYFLLTLIEAIRVLAA